MVHVILVDRWACWVETGIRSGLSLEITNALRRPVQHSLCIIVKKQHCTDGVKKLSVAFK